MKKAIGWTTITMLCAAGSVMAQGKRTVRVRRAVPARSKAKVTRGVPKATAAKLKRAFGPIREAEAKKQIEKLDRAHERMHKALAAQSRAFVAAAQKEPGFPAFRKKAEQIVASIKRDIQAVKRSSKLARAKEKGIAEKVRALAKLKKQNEPMLARAYANVHISKKKLAELALRYLKANGPMILDPTGLGVIWAAPSEEEPPQTDLAFTPPFTDWYAYDSATGASTSGIADNSSGLVQVSLSSAVSGRGYCRRGVVEHFKMPQGYELERVAAEVQLDSYSASVLSIGADSWANASVRLTVRDGLGTALGQADTSVVTAHADPIAFLSEDGSGTFHLEIGDPSWPSSSYPLSRCTVEVSVSGRIKGYNFASASATGFVKNISVKLRERR